MTTEQIKRPEQQRDWATDYDIFDPDYVRDPYPIWDELREKCPVAHYRALGRLLDADQATPTSGPSPRTSSTSRLARSSSRP